jgi:glycosyltransferase involved in cell wall biosynthesis
MDIKFQPKLSIITINKDNSAGLEDTINSVIQQSFKDFELIIIDGASSDSSIDVIKRYKTNFYFYLSEPDSGIYDAMNKGINKATGDYVLFLNSGDRLYNSEILYEVFSKGHSTDIIYGNIIHDSNGKFTPYIYPSELSFAYLLRYSLPHQATFIKRQLFEKIGLYSTEFKIVSDWEWFIKCFNCINIKYVYINNFITIFDSSGLSLSSKNQKFIGNERFLALKKLYSGYSLQFLQDYFELENKYWNIRNNKLFRVLLRLKSNKFIFIKKDPDYPF